MIIKLDNQTINGEPIRVFRKSGKYTTKELEYWGEVIGKNLNRGNNFNFKSYKTVQNYYDNYVELVL